MNNIFLHIPHSGDRLPKVFWDNIILSKEEVLDFKHLITDSKTRELFGNNHYKRLCFSCSRIFCDVEKFVEDSDEIMSQFGMGVVYTKTHNGEILRNVNPEYKQYVLNKFYYPYHEKLNRAALSCLKKGTTILVDCHSFSKDIIMLDDKKKDLPDICIGFNSNYNKKLIKFVITFFKNLGYKVSANYPYSGTIIPNVLITNPNDRFHSFMIEINKKLYLNNYENFVKLQREINNLLHQLENLDLNF